MKVANWKRTVYIKITKTILKYFIYTNQECTQCLKNCKFGSCLAFEIQEIKVRWKRRCENVNHSELPSLHPYI